MRQNRGDNDSRKNLLSPHAVLSNAYLQDYRHKTIARRPRVDATVRDLVQYLEPEDADDVRHCRKYILRFHDPRLKADSIGTMRCKSPWCSWCAPEDHVQRTQYQARKIASLDPAAEPKPALINLVWELPKPFHTLARTSRALIPEWLHAVRRTIAFAYGYAGRHGKMPEAVCWSEMGAIVNFHAFGDRATPWPQWMPHFDMLVPAWLRRDGAMHPIRTSWPELYPRTQARYRTELREALLPFVTEGEHRDARLDAFLRTEFAVDFHVSRAPGGGIIHKRTAMHRIRYSCRPLFTMDRAKLRIENDKAVVIYTPPHKRGERIVHRVPPGPAFACLRSLRTWLFHADARNHIGTLHSVVYPTVARLAGHIPVRQREPSGKKLKAAYAPGPDGRYMRVDPRSLRGGVTPRSV